MSKRRYSLPVPPPLPVGRLHALADRGEVFVRSTGVRAGALPVVLLHGWMAAADTNFYPVFDRLAARHQVIAPDLRGHGRTLYPEVPFTLEDAADDVAALLRDLGTGPCVIVGYSLGTTVTQLLVARHPDVVAGIVLAGGEFAPKTRLHEKVYDRLGGWHATALGLTTGRWSAHRLVDKAVKEHQPTEDIRGWLVCEFERGHLGSQRAAGRALARFDGRPIAAANSGLPAAVVITRRDHLVRPARQEKLAGAWAAEVFDLDADHDAPIAQPVRFTDAICDAVAHVASRASVVSQTPTKAAS